MAESLYDRLGGVYAIAGAVASSDREGLHALRSRVTTCDVVAARRQPDAGRNGGRCAERRWPRRPPGPGAR